MTIKYAKCENFLSYQSLAYAFMPVSVLIQGVNKTDDDQESNGTGKTAFQSIIEYCLYGNTSQKIRDKDLIRIGQRESRLSIAIHCAVRQETLMIERVIKKHGASKITLIINDVPQAVATVLDGNRFIDEWVVISREDLQNYYVINKERHKSFFYASNTEKIQIISRFSNSHLIDSVFPSITKKIASLDEQLELQKLERAKTEGAIETIELQLNSKSDDSFEQQKKLSLLKIKADINDTLLKIQTSKQLKNNSIEKISTCEDEILTFEKNTKEAHSQLKVFDVTKVEDRLIKSRDSINLFDSKWKDIDHLKKKRISDYDDLSKILAKVQMNLSVAVTCPKCSHEFFPGDADADVQLEKQKQIKISSILEKIKLKIDDFAKNLEEIVEIKVLVMETETKLLRKRNEISNQIQEIKKTISALELSVKELQSSIKTEKLKAQENEATITRYHETISELKQKYIETEQSQFDVTQTISLKENIKKNKAIWKTHDEQVKETEEKLYQAKQWLHSFKSFKAYLANRFLQVIEGLSNKYLLKLKSDLQIKWEGYKAKADGTLSEKITALIIRNSDVRDFSSFSGGERARMDFALILSIRELINNAHPYGGLDFLFIDERFEGLDGLGLSNLMRSISDFNYPILITTHVTDSNIYGNILTVVKEHGISKLYE